MKQSNSKTNNTTETNKTSSIRPIVRYDIDDFFNKTVKSDFEKFND